MRQRRIHTDMRWQCTAKNESGYSKNAPWNSSTSVLQAPFPEVEAASKSEQLLLTCDLMYLMEISVMSYRLNWSLRIRL